MNKIYISVLSIILALAFTSCSDEDDVYEPWNPTEVIGINVDGIEKGVLNLYTTTDIKESTHQLKITYTPENATNIKDCKFNYTSNDTTIFTVDGNGLITVKSKVGEAILKIVEENNAEIQFACAVVTTDEVFGITEIAVVEGYENYIASNKEIVDLNKFIIVKPDNATSKKVKFSLVEETEVATLDEETGILTCLDEGEVTVRVTADDGLSDVTIDLKITIKNPTYLDKTGWSAIGTYPAFIEKETVGDYHLLFDGKTNTHVAIIKPGKTMGPTTVPKNAEISFVLTMAKKEKFDIIQLIPNLSNTSINLRLLGAKFYGSNDNVKFEAITEELEFDSESKDIQVALEKAVEYKYIKVHCTKWHTGGGNTIQLAEMNVGNTK